MAIKWWTCPGAPTMRQFDAPWGPEHCHVESRMDDFCGQICFYRTKKVFWQGSDINVRIHIFIENDQIANTLVANSGKYFSIFPYPHPPVTMCKVEPWFIGKSKQDQLFGTVQLRVLVHHRRRRSLFLNTNVRFLYSNTAVDCLYMGPSLDSSFRKWMSEACSKLLWELDWWAKSDALYKPTEIALIAVFFGRPLPIFAIYQFSYTFF